MIVVVGGCDFIMWIGAFGWLTIIRFRLLAVVAFISHLIVTFVSDRLLFIWFIGLFT